MQLGLKLGHSSIIPIQVNEKHICQSKPTEYHGCIPLHGLQTISGYYLCLCWIYFWLSERQKDTLKVPKLSGTFKLKEFSIMHSPAKLYIRLFDIFFLFHLLTYYPIPWACLEHISWTRNHSNSVCTGFSYG